MSDLWLSCIMFTPPRSTIAQEPMTWQQWASVLKLSTMWGFHAVRQKAITNLASSEIDPVDKIILSKKHDVATWLVPALTQLARREEPLSIEDARRLSRVAGWEFSIQLGHVRETYVATPRHRVSDLGWSCQYGCTSWNCYNHHLVIILSSPTDPVTWPCPSCQEYRCSGNHAIKSKPAQPSAAIPRSQYDFTVAIRRVYDINS
jgi:hypothetical protein